MSRFSDYRKEHLLPIIAKLTDYKVRSGPFKGLKIMPIFSSSDGAICQKLMGWYEEELHPFIERVIASSPDAVLNWGCADGYYSTGFSMRMPSVPSINVDLLQSAIQIALVNAAANGIQDLHVSADSSTEKLSSTLSSYSKPFVFMDIEGDEDKILNLDEVPELNKATILVEMHDCFNPGVTDRVLQRFAHSHQIEKIEQTVKNPYIPELSFLGDDDKMMLVSDGRACSMHWLFLTPN